MATKEIVSATVEDGLQHGFIGVVRHKVDATPGAATAKGATVNSDDAPTPSGGTTGKGAAQPSKQDEKKADSAK